MRVAGRSGNELGYTAFVQHEYGQLAQVWPLPFAAFFGIILFTDIGNLWNVTLGAPMLAVCLYQFHVTKKELTLQVRNCWRLQCVMAAYVYAHFLTGAVKMHPVAVHGDIICNLYATVPQQLFSMFDSLPPFTVPLYFVSHVCALFLQHIWLTGHRWPIALARSAAVHAICLTIYLKLARHCRNAYRAMVNARIVQPSHAPSPKSSEQEDSSVSDKSQMDEGIRNAPTPRQAALVQGASTPSAPGNQLQVVCLDWLMERSEYATWGVQWASRLLSTACTMNLLATPIMVGATFLKPDSNRVLTSWFPCEVLLFWAFLSLILHNIRQQRFNVVRALCLAFMLMEYSAIFLVWSYVGRVPALYARLLCNFDWALLPLSNGLQLAVMKLRPIPNALLVLFSVCVRTSFHMRALRSSAAVALFKACLANGLAHLLSSTIERYKRAAYERHILQKSKDGGSSAVQEGLSGSEVSTPSGEQQQSGILQSQQQQQQQQQEQREQQEQQQTCVERDALTASDSGPIDSDADAVQLNDAVGSALGAAGGRKPYQSRRTHLEVSLTLEGALSPEMLDAEFILQLVYECERLCPCYVLDLAMRSGCVVLSFDITVLRDKAACKAICSKVLAVAKDWVRGRGIQDPISKSTPGLLAQAWDCFAQVREVAAGASSIIETSKAPKPRLTLPKPSLLMPLPPPCALIATPGSHRRSTEAHTTHNLELEVCVSMGGGVAPNGEVLGWEGRKDSPEDDRHTEEGVGNAAQHMRLLARAQGRFLAVCVLGRELKGGALVLKVCVALPRRVLASKGCPLTLQLWQGGCMLCSSIAALLPHAMADTHTELSTWLDQEQQLLTQKKQLLQQRKQLLLQQRQALQQQQEQQQEQQQAQQKRQEVMQQLEQLEQGPDLGVQEFLADLSEWLMFQGGHSNSVSSSNSRCTSRSNSSKADAVRASLLAGEIAHADSTTSDEGASQQSETVSMMRDVGLDLLLHSLRYRLEKFSVVLLRGLASPPFNLASATIASEPAFLEEPAIQKALAAATAAAAATASKAASMSQADSVGGEEASPQEQQQQQHTRQWQQWQQSVGGQTDADPAHCVGRVLAPLATHEEMWENEPCLHSSNTAQSGTAFKGEQEGQLKGQVMGQLLSYSSWLVSQHRMLVVQWALMITIALVVHAIHHSCSLRTLSSFVGGVLVGGGIVCAALRSALKQVQLLVLCLATLQVVFVHSMASAAESPFLLHAQYGLDLCVHLLTTVPYLLLLKPSLTLLPILPLANVISNAKLYQHVAGHALPLAFLRASALQALSLAIYAIIQRKAKAGFAAYQAITRQTPKTILPTDEIPRPSERHSGVEK